MTKALGLFAKWPQRGVVKTRLAAATSAPWAADVAQAFLKDVLLRLTQVDARRVLVYSPKDADKYFAGLVRGDFELLPQVHGDLGERLFAFFSHMLGEGAERVVVVGTDSPTLPVALVEAALDQLQNADVVLGPATDGGYYLIGCAQRVPPVFHGIAWSSTSVLAETVSRLQQASLRLALLPPWYDVDTLDDWRMLRGHLLAMRCAGVDPEVPHTEALPAKPS
jgi:rSAM/selenodomain-associated transferase 1